MFAADKNPLLHKHSPSCSNRFANLILEHFSVSAPPPPPHCGADVLKRAQALGGVTSWPFAAAAPAAAAAFEVQEKTQHQQPPAELFAALAAHKRLFTLFKVIKSVKLQLVKPKMCLFFLLSLMCQI